MFGRAAIESSVAKRRTAPALRAEPSGHCMAVEEDQVSSAARVVSCSAGTAIHRE